LAFYDAYTENGAYLTIFLVSLLAGAGKLAQQTDSRFTLPGALNRSALGADYLSRSASVRQQRMDACVKTQGYRGCLQALLALEGEQGRKGAKALVRDHRYLVQAYGAPAEQAP
jgi:hypothetical protein